MIIKWLSARWRSKRDAWMYKQIENMSLEMKACVLVHGHKDDEFHWEFIGSQSNSSKSERNILFCLGMKTGVQNIEKETLLQYTINQVIDGYYFAPHCPSMKCSQTPMPTCDDYVLIYEHGIVNPSATTDSIMIDCGGNCLKNLTAICKTHINITALILNCKHTISSKFPFYLKAYFLLI